MSGDQRTHATLTRAHDSARPACLLQRALIGPRPGLSLGGLDLACVRDFPSDERMCWHVDASECGTVPKSHAQAGGQLFDGACKQSSFTNHDQRTRGNACDQARNGSRSASTRRSAGARRAASAERSLGKQRHLELSSRLASRPLHSSHPESSKCTLIVNGQNLFHIEFACTRAHAWAICYCPAP
ncbi:hypothetical protein IE81DRAFT_65170 [Ceraceosorus guamensis]|uniref:Uncharacterized protein n=1 Tax=Ceraceosorus guamensis TaxID=1522189 RepID=A0A316W1Y7_9BASI|nr:hypothetical protein IE81DRAFT_65170 [Ceraceosorus guamensis]PWN43689.1 hypothetical protein IE81DRAFT_65170 [Ceraceosorus guamensis]